ncbi:MAG: KpsF/GutQ family sugar-phosphate isomerase [Phycisphaerae bacterium]|nr:KpsF/GutQ family sugar-phosphate isomerase [Phycisphaerae bacterium]MDD5381691.1 KpsF/GutQ family sugar-phosphate isomerase [Phycisphaerae bacterium]
MNRVISNISKMETKKKAVVELHQQKSKDKFISYAKEVFKIEAEAITELSQRVDDVFSKAVKVILECNGRVIVCGMGKSGIIGRKISCTLASTGTPSFFMHPAEAFHGDLGMIKKEDILMLISYSGETEEILKIIPFLKGNGNRIISMTGNPNSTIASSSQYHLNVNVKREACPLKIAPTTSATVSLVMGDAITIALMRERGFKAEDFARFHPGGSVGRMLLTRVEDVMVKNNLPIITEYSDIKDVIQVMTSGRWGTSVVVDSKEHVIGIITDGDLRRALSKHGDILMLKARDIMTKNPKTISKDLKLYEAEKIFNTYEIITLLVCSGEGKLLGLLSISMVCTPKTNRIS